MVYSDGSPEFNKVVDEATMIHDAGKFMQSFHFLDSAFRAINPQNPIDQSHYYDCCYNLYKRDIKDHSIAAKYSDSLMMVAEKAGKSTAYPMIYAAAYFSKGDIAFVDKNYNDAYQYYFKARTLAKDKVDDCIMTDYNYRLGMISYKQERYDEAAKTFKDCFDESKNCPLNFPVFYRRQEVLDNIGLCYFNSGNYDSALLYYTKAQNYINSYENKFPNRPAQTYTMARAVILGNMASVYLKTGKLNKAEGLLKNSISINTQPGYDLNDAQLSRLKLAKLYLQIPDHSAVKNILQEVKNTLDTLPSKQISLGWNDMMWQYYTAQKDTTTAFNYLLQYKLLKQSLDEQNKQLSKHNLEDKIKNLDTQYQINALQKNDRLKQTYLAMAVLVVILLISTLIFFLQSWKKSKENIAILSNLNKQINGQKDKLEQILEELELSNREKDRIMWAVAHDIRNPIAAISSLIELLNAEGEHTPAQKELIGFINTACNDALSLSRDILSASQPVNSEKIELEKVDINLLLHDGIDLLKFRAAEKNQQIVLSLSKDVHAIFINKEKIWRVVSNLVTNAIKFSQANAVIDVATSKINNTIYITVHDNGIGIPDKIKDKVFEMFTEAKRPGTAGEKPFGLGLAISKQIIEAHGGKLWFESSLENGTTFYITLPVTA